jgi:VWFA-related protein
LSTHPRHRALLLIAAVLLFGVSLAQDSPPEPPPATERADEEKGQDESQNEILESNVVEELDVALAEFKILVTDKRGRPIVDLRADEIEVLEGGVPQRLAYLETVSESTPKPSGTSKAPSPATVYTPDGEETTGDVSAVLPAKPKRRVAMVFDVRNSKKRNRDHWHDAAMEWLRYEMQPDDWVSIVIMRSYPDWLVDFTQDKDVLAGVLEKVSLAGTANDRDRRNEVTRLVQDIFHLCSDPGRLPSQQEKKSTTSDVRYGTNFDEQGCAYNLVEGYVQEWHSQSLETIDSLRALTGQLAAIPGRKAVLYFSEGIIEDATSMGVSAMLSVFGPQKIDISDITWRLNKNAYTDVRDLHRTARGADVSFFTFDTRSGADGSFGGTLEHGHTNYQNTYNVNPWGEMQSETRQTLNALAKETGGRAYHGAKDLADDVIAAADSFFGMYAVGYYRADPRAPLGKVKVRINRKRLAVDYPDRAWARGHQARGVSLDMTIGRPSLVGDGKKQSIPVSLTLPFDSLPFRRGGGGRGTVLGIHLQAIRPDGTIAAERLDIETVVTDRDERRDARGKLYLHETNIRLGVGAYRIRARISDDRQEIIADRSIDLTLELGSIVPGIRTGDEVAATTDASGP